MRRSDSKGSTKVVDGWSGQYFRPTHYLHAGAVPVGAGLPANTGAAGAMHRVAFFAGEPAPTRTMCIPISAACAARHAGG
ncbi:protein of unknown function [Pseudomonas sp. JV551A1]|uniref:Uncharacterized protein n=1 Tax=Pseudomonas inefficax TaxID=2078786 RepID=A0AAQ1PCK8_9PSED|nr:protein of unknown function [Pseudomonas sp. JV551A1]SPO61792.1 protein of unknown function [Pseudomonas inefficax]